MGRLRRVDSPSRDLGRGFPFIFSCVIHMPLESPSNPFSGLFSLLVFTTVGSWIVFIPRRRHKR